MKRIIIDVREAYEYEESHIDGAINISPVDLMQDTQELKDIPKDTEIILYCLSGSRSAMAMHFLKAKGFTNLINGINEDQVRAKYL